MSILPDHWYYNTETGQLTHGNNLLNLGNNLLGFGFTTFGWHELNIPGSATGVQAAAEAKKEFPQGKTPDYSPVTPAKVAKTAATEAGQAAGVSNPLSGLAAIGDFFSRLTQASTWIRVAEVITGAALIIVALARLASGTPVGRAAAKAGKAAMIL